MLRSEYFRIVFSLTIITVHLMLNMPSRYKWRGFYSAEQESYNSLLILSKKIFIYDT